MKQLNLETRTIIAEIGNEGGEILMRFPVFAWMVCENDTIEPLFIDSDFLSNGKPYGIKDVNYISGKDLEIVGYEWIK